MIVAMNTAAAKPPKPLRLNQRAQLVPAAQFAEWHRIASATAGLIEQPKPLNGAELRFLRLEMDLSQARLGAILGSTEQNVRRWEKIRGQPIQGPADRICGPAPSPP
jgi:DNA-binding transcriptional regulator YiaG